MKTVTDLFLSSLTGSHAMVAGLHVVGHGPDPSPGAELPVIGGAVTLDASADTRGSIDITVAGTWPTGTDIVADGRIDGTATVPHPYGVQIRPYRGIRYGNGTTETIGLGIYVVETIEQVGLRTSPAIRVTGRDRSCLVAAALSPDPIQWWYDVSSWADVITTVLALGHSLLTYAADFDTSSLIGDDLVLEEGKDPWSFLVEALSAIGKIAYFDELGVCRIVTPPDPGAAVWTVAAGPGGAMTSTGRHLTRDGQYNGVLVIGEKSSGVAPARAVAYDTGTSSPTAWGDAFGRRLKVVANNLVVDDADAAVAAALELSRTVGMPYSLDLGAVPNPALEPWDVLSVVHPDGTTELHSVDSVRIPLSATDPLSLATRETSTVVVSLA